MLTIAQTLAHYVAADTLPDVEHLTRLAAPGLRERILRESGLTDLQSEIFRWSLTLPSFDVMWQIASGPVPFAGAFDALENSDISRGLAAWCPFRSKVGRDASQRVLDGARPEAGLMMRAHE